MGVLHVQIYDMYPIMHFGQLSGGGCLCLQAGNGNRAIPGTGGETSRELSLSRELSTNEIALFSIVFINAQFIGHNICIRRKI